jgi:hypothetical protein
MFVVTVALGAIAVFSYVQIRSYRYRHNPVYQAALSEVQTNDQLQDRLGAPIVDSDWNPQGAIEIRDNATIGDAKFNFSVSGPDGYADVSAEGRMVDGEWAVTGLEVLFPDGDRADLSEQIRAKQKVDTPEFDPQAQQKKQDKNDESQGEPPPDVSVEVPDLPSGIK